MLVLRIIDLAGASLFVRSHGDPTGRVLLVLHGGPGWDHSYLLPALDDLVGLRYVVLFDLRGCGRSSRDLDVAAYQPDRCVDDAAALITRLGADRADVLGSGHGGQLAMLLAQRYPHLVDRLVLASTTAYPAIQDDLSRHPEHRRRAPAVEAAVAASLADPTVEQTRATAMAAAPLHLWDLDLLAPWRAVLDRIRFSDAWNPGRRAGTLHPPLPADPERALRNLRRPTLILHGAQDLVFPVRAAHRLHAAVPLSELAVLDDAGHAAHFEARAGWVDRVRAFLGP
ncbi:MAG TPA: alpha/beta hydrolase [Pseudonocardia sp.]|nr:alpha/beta hydrolase [Pseudonocardia sp.]